MPAFRTAAQLAGLLIACLFTCFLVSLTQPVAISGTAFNVLTGQPMPHVHILFDHLNSASHAAITDADGHFTAYSPRAAYCCWLFAAGPEAGTLLQANFITEVNPLFPGDHFFGVTIYAVPATELAGHVYHEDGSPASGCEVAALTRVADIQQPFAWVFSDKTDSNGAYRLTRLGTDRYTLVIHCSGSIRQTRDVVLKPGVVIHNFDFRLRSVKMSFISGSVNLVPGPDIDYAAPFTVIFHDVTATNLDPGFADLNIRESCSWGRVTDPFRCGPLPPGRYRLHFTIDYGLGGASNIPAQEAEILVNIQAGQPPKLLNVTMQRVKAVGEPSERAPAAKSLPGTLIIEHACPPGRHFPTMEILGMDAENYVMNKKTFYMPLYWLNLPRCSSSETWTLHPGNYQLIASFPNIGSGRNHKDKLAPLLNTQAQLVTIRSGTTTRVNVKLWTAFDITRLAVNSLNADAANR